MCVNCRAESFSSRTPIEGSQTFPIIDPSCKFYLQPPDQSLSVGPLKLEAQRRQAAWAASKYTPVKPDHALLAIIQVSDSLLVGHRLYSVWCLYGSVSGLPVCWSCSLQDSADSMQLHIGPD